MGIGPWSEERGAKEGRNTASEITSDEVLLRGMLWTDRAPYVLCTDGR